MNIEVMGYPRWRTPAYQLVGCLLEDMSDHSNDECLLRPKSDRSYGYRIPVKVICLDNVYLLTEEGRDVEATCFFIHCGNKMLQNTVMHKHTLSSFKYPYVCH